MKMNIPKMLGSAPTAWWTVNEDRSLMVGLCKYGYLQYGPVWTDPELSFYSKLDLTAQEQSSGEVSVLDAKQGAENAEMEDIQEIDTSFAAEDDHDQMPIDGGDEDILDTTMDDIKTMDVSEGDMLLASTDLEHRVSTLALPSATELGIRIRRLVGALARSRASQYRLKYGDSTKSVTAPLQRSRDYFTKKHKLDFQRVLITYGLVSSETKSDLHDWTVFRGLADLVHKPDEAMEDYLKKVLKLAKEAIVLHEGTALHDRAKQPEPKVTEDMESLSYDRAKKVIKRIDYFQKLREIVLIDSDVVLN